MKDLKRAINFAEEFLEVVKDLERVGNLEQAKGEVERAVSRAKQEVLDTRDRMDEMVVLVEEAQDELKLTKKESEDTLFLAKQAAQEIVTKAKEEADAFVEGTVKQDRLVADRIVEDHERHSNLMAGYRVQEKEALSALTVIEKELADLRARIG